MTSKPQRITGVRIIQIFQGVDGRKGEFALEGMLEEEGLYRSDLGNFEVFVFRSKSQPVIKIMAREGILTVRLPAGRTFEPAYPGHNPIFEAVGRCFGFRLTASKEIKKNFKF